MTTLTAGEVYKLALDQGLAPQNALTATAIAFVESGFRTDAVGVNSDQWTSRDRGLWQINDHWNPDCSDQCAFDPACNAATMARISNGGTNWKPWSSYNNGRYQSALANVTAQVNASGVPSEPVAPSSTSVGLTDIPGKIANGLAWFINPRNVIRLLQFGMGIIAMIIGVVIIRKAIV